MLLPATTLIIERLAPGDAGRLGDFFEAVAADADRFFHPHPLTRAHADDLCARVGSCRDRYFAALWRGRVAGYSLLRGWDEGYAVPSVGVCVHPGLRNSGVGHILMAHAIEQSRAAGAPRIRLTVYKENERGVHLWRKFGFAFSEKNDREYVGVLELAPPPSLPQPRLGIAKLDAWAALVDTDRRAAG